jgi:hypothetical protein
MVDAVGEDKVLDAALDAAQSEGGQTAKKSRWDWVGTVLQWGFWVLAAAFPTIAVICVCGVGLYLFVRWIAQETGMGSGEAFGAIAGFLLCSGYSES